MKNSSTSPGEMRPKHKSFGPFFLGLFLLGIIVAVAIPLYLGYSGMMGGSTPQTALQFSASTPGAQAQIAVEVTRMLSHTLLVGNLLQKNADETYSHTEKTVRVKWDNTKIVMGSSSDVKVGAILQASGVLSPDDTLNAVQIVILTGVVQLK
jgi:hypothetical protein